MYFPNQRCVSIQREEVKKANGRKYLICYIDNLNRAMKELNKSTFQCYIYLLCNKDKYSVEYSTTHISMITSISAESARKAFLELEQKGYIVRSKDNNKFYNFYENPDMREEEREVINPYTGECLYLTYKETIKLFGYTEGLKMWGESNGI